MPEPRFPVGRRQEGLASARARTRASERMFVMRLRALVHAVRCHVQRLARLLRSPCAKEARRSTTFPRDSLEPIELLRCLVRHILKGRWTKQRTVLSCFRHSLQRMSGKGALDVASALGAPGRRRGVGRMVPGIKLAPFNVLYSQLGESLERAQMPLETDFVDVPLPDDVGVGGQVSVQCACRRSHLGGLTWGVSRGPEARSAGLWPEEGLSRLGCDDMPCFRLRFCLRSRFSTSRRDPPDRIVTSSTGSMAKTGARTAEDR